MKPIKDFPNYSICADGRVYSHNTNRFIASFVKAKFIKKYNNYQGYPYVTLRSGGVKKRKPIHRLVAEAYIPNPSNYPQVNHKDGNKLNHSIENLEWVTAKMNVQHAYATGLMNTQRNPEDYPRGPSHPLYKPEAHVKKPRKKYHGNTKYPEEVISRLVELSKELAGIPCKNELIAQTLGLTTVFVSQVLTGRGRGKELFNKDIIKMRLEGVDTRIIAKDLGCSFRLVKNVIEEHHLAFNTSPNIK